MWNEINISQSDNVLVETTNHKCTKLQLVKCNLQDEFSHSHSGSLRHYALQFIQTTVV